VESLDINAVVKSWPVFRDGCIRQFLSIWLDRQIEEARTSLESASEGAKICSLQGRISLARNLKTLLQKSDVNEHLQVIKLNR
jgi:hypothetical protein